MAEPINSSKITPNIPSWLKRSGRPVFADRTETFLLKLKILLNPE
jgi:hypothetical protein